MSQVKKQKQVKKLEPVSEDSTLPVTKEKEKKPRASRAKPKPTKEEALKLLEDAVVEVGQIVQDLKDDYEKIKSMPLKKLHELVADTIKNLEEDTLEFQDQIKEIKSMEDAQ